MATNQTEHYGLSLWESGDAFLREEFNGDHGKIDRALGRLERGLGRVSHDLYQLVLQRYYEGLALPCRALLFDGFADGGRLARLDPAVMRKEGGLWLSKGVQGNVAASYHSQGQSAAGGRSAELTAVGGGVLTRLDYRAGQTGSYSGTETISVWRNGEEVGRQTHTVQSAELRPQSVALEEPVPVAAGDRLYVQFEANRYPCQQLAADGTHVAVGLTFTPLGAASGTAETRAAQAPEGGT